MTQSDRPAATWLSGQPPLWLRLLAIPVAIGAVVAITTGLVDKRGAVVGAAGAVVYGLLMLCVPLAWPRVTAWSRRHPVLDSLVMVPLLFLCLAYVTTLSTGVCLLLALVVGLPLVALAGLLRRRRASLDPGPTT